MLTYKPQKPAPKGMGQGTPARDSRGLIPILFLPVGPQFPRLCREALIG